jgi:hypothetical protein
VGWSNRIVVLHFQAINDTRQVSKNLSGV